MGYFLKFDVSTVQVVSYLRRPGSPKQPADLAQLLSRLSGAAARHRVRIEEAFRDFDRHRDGTVTVPQFSIGLQTAWGKILPVSEKDFQARNSNDVVFFMA